MIYHSEFKELFVQCSETQPHHGINVNRLVIDEEVMSALPECVFGFVHVCNMYAFDRDWEYTYLDIESRFIKAGYPTSTNLWHVDGFPRQEAHAVQVFLFINSSPIEFIVDDVDVETDWTNTREFNDRIGDAKYVTIPQSTIIQYDGHGIHRGVMTTKDSWRTRYRLVKSNMKFNNTKGIECLQK